MAREIDSHMEHLGFDQGSQIVDELNDQGYAIVRELTRISTVNMLARDLELDFASTARSVGPFYGSRTRRFHGLLRRSANTAQFVENATILAVVEAILGPHCDRIQLNLTQAIELEPGSEAQAPHRDQDMWPVRTPGAEYLVNVMWPFTPYTKDNGATIIWPGSHRRQDEMLIANDEAIAAEMYPGDALVFLGSTLHGGGANRTSVSRRGMIISYSLGWLKPYELPWLAYPPEVARTFSPWLAALAGYKAHRPNLGTYEGRCPSTLLWPEGRGPTGPIGAIDCLREDQEDLIRAWRDGRLGEG